MAAWWQGAWQLGGGGPPVKLESEERVVLNAPAPRERGLPLLLQIELAVTAVTTVTAVLL